MPGCDVVGCGNKTGKRVKKSFFEIPNPSGKTESHVNNSVESTYRNLIGRKNGCTLLVEVTV